MANDQTKPRGFAAMDPEKQREIASEGGRAAHEKGTAHEFNSQEAREAGRKGGEASREKNQGTRSSNEVSSRGASSEQQNDAKRQSHKNER